MRTNSRNGLIRSDTRSRNTCTDNHCGDRTHYYAHLRALTRTQVHSRTREEEFSRIRIDTIIH